jgi:predicted nucleic acid-binding protein
MQLIDTNILIADLLSEYEDDPLTKKYLDYYRKIPTIERILPDFILAEMEILLIQVIPVKYKLNTEQRQELKQVTLAYLEKLTSQCILVSTTPPIIDQAVKIYHQNFDSKYISFTDSLYLAMALEHHYSIITQDHKINAIAKSMEILNYEKMI